MPFAVPAALTPQEIENINQRAAAAQAAFARALAQREAGRQHLDLGYVQGVGKSQQDFTQMRHSAGQQLAGRGMAFSPGAAGDVARQLRDQYAAQRANLRQTRTTGLTDLAQQLADAQRQRDQEMTDLARYRAQLGGQFNRLLSGLN